MTFATACGPRYALADPLETLAPESDVNARRRTVYLWIEVGVVILVYLVPSIFNSEAAMYGWSGSGSERGSPTPFIYQALRSIIECAGQIALVLFIIWRSNDPLGRFGLKPFKIGRDLFGGILICALLRGTYHLLWLVLRIALSRDDYWRLAHSGFGSGYTSPMGTIEFALLAIECLASGFVQELVMRAYLIARFEELLGSTPVAILLSTVLFMCYHGYQGTAGIIWTALFGLFQAIIFCLFRRLTPIAIAHALNNFIAIGHVM